MKHVARKADMQIAHCTCTIPTMCQAQIFYKMENKVRYGLHLKKKFIVAAWETG